jgi:hypothetical protein
MGKDRFLHGVDPRRRDPSASAAAARPATPIPAGLSPELQLEFERLRAERDALAAELQEERAERLHAEERLRMLEREKLEQMRQGAASREKLASELEEARLRALRAEARQAALDADLRLAEIGTRRRNRADAESEAAAPPADEVAEPDADAFAAPEAPESSPAEPPAPPRSTARSTPAAARRGRSEAPPAGERPPSQRLSRFSDSPPDEPSSATARMQTPRPSAADAKSGGGGARGGAGARPSAADARTARPGAGDPGSRGSRGGAADSRPRVDRAQLESRLVSGAVIQTTERFRQFQPVAPAHLKVSDWLAQVSTYGELQAKAEGQLPASTVLDVLVLFLERSFITIDG